MLFFHLLKRTLLAQWGWANDWAQVRVLHSLITGTGPQGQAHCTPLGQLGFLWNWHTDAEKGISPSGDFLNWGCQQRCPQREGDLSAVGKTEANPQSTEGKEPARPPAAAAPTWELLPLWTPTASFPVTGPVTPHFCHSNRPTRPFPVSAPFPTLFPLPRTHARYTAAGFLCGAFPEGKQSWSKLPEVL